MAKKTILGYDERLKRCQYLNVLEVADVAVMITELKIASGIWFGSEPYHTIAMSEVI